MNSRRPVERLEDLQGLRLRVSQSSVYIDVVNALGANAMPLAIPELYGALEQKAVDGADALLSFIRLQNYDEVQDHLILPRHPYNAQAVLVGARFWERLSGNERAILRDVARVARVHQR